MPASGSHSSWFSYPVSRSHPFQWFTPLTVAGGLILTVLFTLVNLASSGFDLVLKFTSDLNGTMAGDKNTWFMQAPFAWESSIETSCQPKLLTVGDRFFTTNLGFRYEVKAIKQPRNGFNREKALSSLSYWNYTLEDCYLKFVTVELRKSDHNVEDTSWWLKWVTSFTTSTAVCSVMTDEGLRTLNLDIKYAGRTDWHYPYVINDDFDAHATTWWGTRLLNLYFTTILQATGQRQKNLKREAWVYGRIGYERNESQTDIHKPDFFNLYAWFLGSENSTQRRPVTLERMPTNKTNRFCPVLTAALHHAKILHSLVAADLGNNKTANLLTEKELPYAILPSDEANREIGQLFNLTCPENDPCEKYTKFSRPNATRPRQEMIPVTEVYSEFVEQTGPLKRDNATVVAQYLCSVPKRKSAGVMILAIVLANLVFLQAAWKLLTWIAQGILPDSQTTVCLGCLQAQNQDAAIKALPGDRRSEDSSNIAPIASQRVAGNE